MQNPLELPQSTQLTVKPVSVSFKTWANQDFVTETTRNKIQMANALLVPNTGHATNDRYFPQGTAELFHFLQDCKEQGLIVEACIEDDDYKELILHTDLLFIADILVTSAVVPLIVNLISSYIYDVLGSRLQRTTVKSKLTVVQEEGKNAIEFTYEGPAQEYEQVMINAVAKMTNDDQKIVSPSSSSKAAPTKSGKRR